MFNRMSFHPKFVTVIETMAENSIRSELSEYSRTTILPISYTDADGKPVGRPVDPPRLRTIIACYPRPPIFGISMPQLHNDTPGNHKELYEDITASQKTHDVYTSVILVDHPFRKIACANAFALFDDLKRGEFDVELYTSCVRASPKVAK
jgi:hypothetical protein